MPLLVWLAETVTVPSHPSNLPGRIAHHQGIIRYIMTYHRPGTNEGILTNGNTTDNRGVCTNRGATLYNCMHVFSMTIHL